MTDRTTLALAACAGLTDAELAQRGTSAFSKMIERKRKYANAARALAKGIEIAEAALTAKNKQIADLQKQLAAAKSHAAALEQLDAPVTDTAQAAAMLAAISGKTAK